MKYPRSVGVWDRWEERDGAPSQRIRKLPLRIERVLIFFPAANEDWAM